MKRVVSLTLAVALLAAFGLFNASRLFNTAKAQGQGQPPIEAGGGAPEVIKHRTNPHAVDGSVTAGSTAASTSPLTYHGGALIGTPTIYLIWYGSWNGTVSSSDSPTGQQIVRDFASGIGGSNYFHINTTNSAGGQTITGNVNFTPTLNETTDAYSQGSRLRDSGVLTVVNNAITSGRLPYDKSGVYFVLSSSDVAESSGFCTQYCGWHTAATPTAGHVRYSFVGNAARCLSSCAAQSVSPNSNPGVDGMISVIAHELEEATTDADPRSGWVDSGGSENADKCAWTFGSRQTTLPSGAVYNMTLGVRNFLIQRNLSATDNKCYIDGILGYQ